MNLFLFYNRKGVEVSEVAVEKDARELALKRVAAANLR
jgi:hypothetical protein